MLPTRTLKRCPPRDLARVRVALARAAAGRSLPPEDVGAGILAILHATELASDGSAASAVWTALEAAEPGDAELRDRFLALAEADDPLSEAHAQPALWIGLEGAILRRFGTRRRRARHGERPSLRTLFWSRLDAAERREIRALCRKRAHSHGRRVRRGGQADWRLTTALPLLAGLFMRLTGWRQADDLLPYARRGHFIGFCTAALAPLGPHRSLTATALSRRWETAVKARRAEAREPWMG
ncbi:hypothetical protein LNKW23_48370 [Paralimibaculum aggregatum]|uniref:RpsU-divergently transcribed protein n=1 Tax=Paralimibaculum aggregatum TaxID=3036245 RepID=A0ABQ6LU57_9RHOB|nr:hypothetical protein LNKW23_48370 [Limibaculum sp. NKW23]